MHKSKASTPNRGQANHAAYGPPGNAPTGAATTVGSPNHVERTALFPLCRNGFNALKITPGVD